MFRDFEQLLFLISLKLIERNGRVDCTLLLITEVLGSDLSSETSNPD
jgi:hypothetical protein